MQKLVSPAFFDPNVSDYLKQIGRAPLLKAADEKRLFLALENGDKGAREKIIEANLRLVASVAKQFQLSGYGFQDLAQEGTIGLMRAVEKFEWRKGYKFSTYATWWIRQAITRAIVDRGEAIRIPTYKKEEAARYDRAARALEEKLNRQPTTAEIAGKLKMSVAKAREIEALPKALTVLDAPIADSANATLSDALRSEEQAPEDFAQASLLRSRILTMLGGLKDREREIIMLRYGFKDGVGRSLEECAKVFGVSRERVRQVEARALLKLRSPARSKDVRQHWGAA